MSDAKQVSKDQSNVAPDGATTPPIYVLVWSLVAPEMTLQVGEGIELRPLLHPLNVFDLAGLGAAGFREWALLEPLVSECLTEIRVDGAGIRAMDSLGRAWLIAVLLNLRGFARQMAVAVSTRTWNLSEDLSSEEFQELRRKERELGFSYPAKSKHEPFRGHLLDFHTKLFMPEGHREVAVSLDDAEWLSRYFDTADSLADNERFRFALLASSDWRYQVDQRAAISRLWSGIEALLNVRSELSFRIAVTAASLLEPRGRERAERFSEIKKLYERRSRAVHGDRLDSEVIHQTMSSSFRLLSQLLTWILESGRVMNEEDFDQAILH